MIGSGDMTNVLEAWLQHKIAQLTYLHRNGSGIVTQRVELDPACIWPILINGKLPEPPETAWEYFHHGMHVLSFAQDELEITLKSVEAQ